VQIQKTADNLKRIQAQLEKQNKSLTGDIEAQRTQLNQKVFSAQQEADKVTLPCPALPCPALPALPCTPRCAQGCSMCILLCERMYLNVLN